MKMFHQFVNQRFVNIVLHMEFHSEISAELAFEAIIVCLAEHNLTSLFSFHIFSIWQLSLSEGCRLPVRMNGTDDWPLAEIISIRDLQGRLMFYVHYVDCKF